MDHPRTYLGSREGHVARAIHVDVHQLLTASERGSVDNYLGG